MSYSGNFVVTILHCGHVQRETGDRTVVMPDGTEYGVRLRNKHDRRAVGELLIDGESQGSFVVPARSYVDIYRSAEKDRAFKLVHADSTEALDVGKDSSPPNGIVEVRFRLERMRPEVYYPKTPYVPNVYPRKYEQLEPYRYKSSLVRSFNPELSATFNCCSSMPRAGEVGVTVEGSETGQRFSSTSLELESGWTTVLVFLRVTTKGFSGEKGCSVSDDPFCGKCGKKKGAASDNFCRQCGTRF